MSNSNWNNRIVKYGNEDPGQLLANEWNWRIHPQEQQDALEDSLDIIGWVQDVIINLRTSDEWGDSQGVETILDGHARVKLALRHNQDSVPVKYVDLSPIEERQILASLDPIGAMAECDDKMLAEIVNSVLNEGGVIPGLDDKEIDRLLGVLAGDTQQEDNPPSLDKAEELNKKWQVELGDVYEVTSMHGGVHRIVCGDCRDYDTVKLCMLSDKFSLHCSDIPYNLGGVWGGLQEYRENKQVDNDNVDDFDLFVNSFLESLAFSSSENCSYYVWYAIRTNFRQIVEKSGLLVNGVGVWVKEHFNIGRADYHSQYETCLYFSSGKRYWSGARDLSDVWFADRVEQERMHPTQKPLSIIKMQVTNSSKKGDLVGDFFLGSGTTAVACEQLGRLCRGIELHPPYVAVCLERLSNLGLVVSKISNILSE